MSDEPPSRSLSCDVTVLGGDWAGRIPSSETLVARAAAATLDGVPPERRPAGFSELSIALADDATVRGLNRDYRGKDKPTNVLSFAEGDSDFPDLPDVPAPLGEIVLALETVLAEAAEQGKTAADHVTHLTVHGVLHLLDYDHERDDAEAAAQETLETAILAGLGVADPYAGEKVVGENVAGGAA